MQIKFLKDHCNYNFGDTTDNHPNQEYLITLKVAEPIISGKWNDNANLKLKPIQSLEAKPKPKK
jgi:hypothetical protein